MTDVAPEQMLDILKRKARRSNKIHNLEIVHAVCGEIFQLGSADYSFATVGRLAEQRGGLAAKTIYKTASEDYRSLIAAWANFYRNNAKRSVVKPQHASDEDVLNKIDDLTTRTICRMAFSDRNRFREQLNTLKAHSEITIDLRPLPGLANVDTKTGEVIQVISPLESLVAAQLEALEAAISPSFLKDQGWVEGANGEIVNAQGKRIYRAGYAPAIRVVLDAARPTKQGERPSAKVKRDQVADN